MEIKQIVDQNFKNSWDNFVIANSSPASFLQSWEWGDFKSKKQETKNKKQNIFRFGIFENENLIAVAQFVKVVLPFGKFYLNCAKGPIFNKHQTPNTKHQILNLLIQEIKKIAKQENIIFFRIAPLQEYKNINFIKPKILTNLKEPENTLILDLSKSEQELLKAMRQKTRYNLRLAERKGVKISNFQPARPSGGFPISKNNVDIFYNLIKETAERGKINIFSKYYYQELLRITDYGLLITQFIAYYKNHPLAAIIVIYFGDTATYLYGASSDEKRNLMPNYLIQWEAIKLAKNNNYKYYDFWGVDEDKWVGVTRFKKGFGGQEINFIGTFDYILNKKWYNIFRIGKFLKNIL